MVTEFAELAARLRDPHAFTAIATAGLGRPNDLRTRESTTSPPSTRRSEVYREALPLLNAGRVELLDVPRLVAQIASLERRTARGGRDTIDHAPGAHDDVANAALGVLVLASQRKRRGAGTFGRSLHDPQTESEGEFSDAVGRLGANSGSDPYTEAPMTLRSGRWC